MLSSLFSSRIGIGLDISSEVMRLLLLKQKGDKFIVQNQFEEKISDSMEQGKRFGEGLASVLIHLVKQQNLMGRRVAISLPTNKVFIKRLQLPMGLSAGELENQVLLQAKRDITEDCYIDFFKLAEHPGDFVEVLIAAALKEEVNHRLTYIHRAGLRVHVIDVEMYALLRPVLFYLRLNAKLKAINFCLFLIDERCHFIVFDLLDIVFYKTWKITAKWLEDFQTKIQEFKISYPLHEIKNIYVFSTNKNQNLIISLDDVIIENALLPISPLHFDLSFLIAYGLAMREFR